MDTLALPISSISSSPDGLSNILEPECNLAIWEREPLSGLAELLEARPSDIRFTTKLKELPRMLSAQLEAQGFPDLPGRAALMDDIVRLSVQYCDILRLDEVEVRLEVVTTNSCRKWHADFVTARLITTYIGTGTQWLDAQDAERVRDGKEPSEINSLKAGATGIFKGKLATDFPAIHRSPPIEGTGDARLLLVLNPADSN